MGIATSGPRRQPSPQLLTGSMAPAPARVRVSGAHAAVVEVAQDVAAQRAINFLIAAIALFLALPLLLLIAVAIKLTSRGPVLYTQERVGLGRRVTGTGPDDPRRVRDLGGRPFTIYKFRTMRVDAEAQSGAVWATQNDPRVTPVGRFLRQYRLDEIPQLLNVMRGEMNIVGPRPERPTIFAELREHIKEYPLRQR
ncbi:MAG: sugar transferase, partial [Chloroflexota bacterium]|nr:sugar transferase [Chloroflexota bacterium]